MTQSDDLSAHRTYTNDRNIVIDPRGARLPLVPPRATLYAVEPLEDRD